jgi:uncharacterized protein (DUF1778 family)
MLSFEIDEAVQGAKTARMEQRTTQQAKDLIERAASLLGINASEFTVVAAMRAARQTMRDYSITVLEAEQHRAFLDALDATEPTPDMRSLMKLHAEVRTSK